MIRVESESTLKPDYICVHMLVPRQLLQCQVSNHVNIDIKKIKGKLRIVVR